MNAPSPSPSVSLAVQLSERVKRCRDLIHKLSFSASSSVDAARQLKDVRRQFQALRALQGQVAEGRPLDPNLVAMAGVDVAEPSPLPSVVTK